MSTHLVARRSRSPATAASEGRRPIPAIRVSDVRGFTRLAFDATVGVAALVEAMHHNIARRSAIVGPAPAGRPSGITGLVYRTVQSATDLIGDGVDTLLAASLPQVDAAGSSEEREAIVAALNGVLGDHLAASRNPLAITMALRRRGTALGLAESAPPLRVRNARPHVVVLVHGLCMNDRQWRRNGHDHGAALARDLRFTPVYLHYNTGLHVSENGRAFAGLLAALVERWPVPVEELSIVGHSMGGLVARSACHIGEHEGHRWPALLRKLVFLGTPHHGALLERGGHGLDKLLRISPYIAPFARLGGMRSAGITDLRFGNLQDADWKGRDRRHQSTDDRRLTPLPECVAAHVIAATTAERVGTLRSEMIGDGLVPLASALGEHKDAHMRLAVPRSRRWVATSANHFDLLDRADVYAKLRAWLGEGHAP
jgi:pimeloyl-ACP methyl ester carboxylesterase